MEVKFGQHRFSKEQGLLYCGDELIVLKRNQANLLTLFIEQPEHIFSKDEILERVWRGRVVSEQVVFQTISQLRAILGDDAITTFAKKGYKWQLTTVEAEPYENKTPPAQATASASLYFAPLKNIAMLSFIAISLVAFYLYAGYETPPAKTSAPQLHVLLADQTSDVTTEVLQNIELTDITASPFSEQMNVIHSPRHISDLLSAPKATWKKANLPLFDWLLFGATYGDKNGTFLHYALTKDNVVWSGYLHGKTPEALTYQIQQKLTELEQIGLFNAELSKLALAELLRLYNKAPNAPELQLLLAEEYVYMGQFDTALAMLKQLTDTPSKLANIPYQAEAYWLIGKIYKIREQHQMANLSLDKMADVLAVTPLWNLNFQNIKTSALLAFEAANYDRMFDVLTQGEVLAEQQADPYTQFDLHILFAMLSGKAGDKTQKEKHLKLAQALINEHNLDDANLVSFYYLLAEQASGKLAMLPFFEKILNLPRTANNYWLHDDALLQTVKYYITNRDFNRAHQLVKSPEDSVLTMKLKADIWLAQNKPELALPLLQNSFDQARLQFNRLAGLEAAKTLLTLDDAYLVDKREYLAYVEHNSDKVE